MDDLFIDQSDEVYDIINGLNDDEIIKLVKVCSSNIYHEISSAVEKQEDDGLDKLNSLFPSNK